MLETNLLTVYRSISFAEDEESSKSILKSYAVWDFPLTDIFTRIWTAMNRTGWVNSSREGLDLVLSSDKDKSYALLIDYPTGKYLQSKNCSVLTIDNLLANKFYTFGFPKDSNYTRKFSEM
jgi:hypothetical protein